jgi:four helix bundle protein
MAVRSYRELIAWQKAMDFVTEVYRATRTFPKEEIYGMTSQLRRAAVSIPSNIAEGQGRQTTGEFRQFLGHARGSLLETETQIVLSERLGISRQQDNRGDCRACGRIRANPQRSDTIPRKIEPLNLAAGC